MVLAQDAEHGVELSQCIGPKLRDLGMPLPVWATVVMRKLNPLGRLSGHRLRPRPWRPALLAL